MTRGVILSLCDRTGLMVASAVFRANAGRV